MLVPIILTSFPGPTPEPTAPMCASSAPVATGMSCGRSSFWAHSFESFPAGWSIVEVCVGSVFASFLNLGLSCFRKSTDGYPPHWLENIALCPAAQALLIILFGSVIPQSIAGMKSHASIHVCAAS